jgi:hypothetical protein
MSAFLEDLVERLERELATLQARVALDKAIGAKEIQGYLGILELWAFSAGKLNEPWSGEVSERARQLGRRLQEGGSLGQIHVGIMELLIDTSHQLFSVRKRMAYGLPAVSGEKSLRISEKNPPLKAICKR